MGNSRAWGLGLLLVAIGLAELTPLDFWLQDHLFNAAAGTWLVDGNEPIGRTLFYNGPKVVLILVAVGLLGLTVGPARWRSALAARGWLADRKHLLFALVAAGAVPATVGVLKNHSGVHCPSELIRYGGESEFSRPFAHGLTGNGDGHCWPAGHASGGFALLALTLLTEAAPRRRMIRRVAYGLGWIMALYQMAKGAHFLSHTLVTVALAIVLVGIAGGILGRLTKA